MIIENPPHFGSSKDKGEKLQTTLLTTSHQYRDLRVQFFCSSPSSLCQSCWHVPPSGDLRGNCVQMCRFRIRCLLHHPALKRCKFKSKSWSQVCALAAPTDNPSVRHTEHIASCMPDDCHSRAQPSQRCTLAERETQPTVTLRKGCVLHHPHKPLSRLH